MTILYKVQNNKQINDNYILHKCVLCTISNKNIVAFSTQSDICSVYVCDIVTPWQIFNVCSLKRVVTVLEWNYTGELLLIGSKEGNIEIWSTRSQLINSWILLYKTLFKCEDIINAKFFHNGKSIFFNSQKKDLPSYTEKFERLEYKPTITQFGNVSTEGCITLTASGLLGVFIIPALNNYNMDNFSNHQAIELNVTTHIIGLSRSFISSCSILHSPNGSIRLALNCGWQENIIYCSEILAKLERENLTIKCESLPNVFLNVNGYKRITQFKWAIINNENILFVAYDGMHGNILEQWSLIRKHQCVHKLLQKNKNEFVQNESWEIMAKTHFPAKISQICLPKMFSDTTEIYILLDDNTVQVIEPGLKKIGLTGLERQIEDRLLDNKFITADISPMNQLLLVFDNYGQMYAAQIANSHFDKSFRINSVSYQVSLLEYCIITGIDASDILLLNLSNLDIIIEKLTENFTRQPTYTRHFYYSNFLSLKSNICRIQSKQQDFDNLILLHSISITFKSLLRPSSDLSYQDKGPADNLAIILSESVPDVDKVLFNLDAKDFTVEPLTLQSLQQLIQWVADLALHILNKLPDEGMKTKLNKKQGYDISRDIVAIGSIREILVMIRIWGLLNSQCLPIYTKSVENVDVLSILFRLLTRLAQNTTEPDDILLDECSALSTQVVIPPRQFTNPATLLNCYMTVIKSLPLLFTTAVEPIGLQDVQVKEVMFPSSTKDGISNLQLGVKASAIKKCIRCGFVNSIHKVAKTSALKAWCNRWLYCHCGGYWKTI